MSLPLAYFMSFVRFPERAHNNLTGNFERPVYFEVLQSRADCVLLLACMPNLAREMRA